ncbi:MAG: hypothetical protein ACXVCL_18720, partial [Bdellovibrio sp.]
MILFFRLIVLFLFLSSGFIANAQVGLEGISTGRYEIRKSKQRKPASVVDSAEEKTTLKPSETVARPMDSNAVNVSNPSPAKATSLQSPQNITVIVDKKNETDKQKSVALPVENENSDSVIGKEPSLKEQAESLFSNKTEDIYEFYREQIHPEDDRNNRVELDINPVAAYMDSQSNYSYRKYHSFFNGLKVKSNVWFTPRIGISGQFMFSLAADLDSMDAANSRIPAKYEYLDLGVNFRTFFGASRKYNSVEFALLYSENKTTVPNDNTSRARLKTSGFGLGVKNRIPSSANYAWVFGGSFFPRLDHAETQTGAAITSGTSQESVRFG